MINTYRYRRMWKQSLLLRLLAALALTLALAGCGAAGAVGSGTTSGGSSGGTPGATTSPCRGSIGSGRPTPAVIMRAGNSINTANAHVGDVVEIRLDTEHVWQLNTVSPADALQAVGAQGAPLQGACAWDFRMLRAGDVTVTFTGSPNCHPPEMCPAYALLAEFSIQSS